MALFFTPGTSAVDLMLQRGPDAREVRVAATYGNPIDTGTDVELTALLRRRHELREGPIQGPVNINPNPIAFNDVSSWTAGAFSGAVITSALTRFVDATAGSGRSVEISWTWPTTGTAAAQLQVYPGPTTLSTWNAVSPGEPWSQEVYVKVLAGASELSRVEADVGFKTTANGFLTQGLGTNAAQLTSFPNAWSLLRRYNAVAPATAGMVYPAILAVPAATAVGGVTITMRVTQSVLYEDDAGLPWSIYAPSTRTGSLGPIGSSPSYRFV